MINFSEHLRKLENKQTRVLLKHSLWGNQAFTTDALHIIDDTDRVGVVFKGQELFIHKNRIINFGVDESKLWVSDGRLTIEINVNNL